MLCGFGAGLLILNRTIRVNYKLSHFTGWAMGNAAADNKGAPSIGLRGVQLNAESATQAPGTVPQDAGTSAGAFSKGVTTLSLGDIVAMLNLPFLKTDLPSPNTL